MVEFTVAGHKNILATHKTTLEFTRDSEVSEAGDCIVGVSSDFDVRELQKLLSVEKVGITLENSAGQFRLQATPNPEFDDEEEMVIRLSEFTSKRTFATHASAAAKDIPRDMVEVMQKGGETKVTIESI